MSSIVGVALDDLVGAVLTKKDDAGFLAQARPASRTPICLKPSACVVQVDKEFLDTEIRLLKERVEQYRLQEVLVKSQTRPVLSHSARARPGGAWPHQGEAGRKAFRGARQPKGSWKVEVFVLSPPSRHCYVAGHFHVPQWRACQED